MVYTVGIPLDGQSLGNSKPQVRANFVDLSTFLEVNHVPLNDLGRGKHKLVQMPDQGAHVTGAGECAIYGQQTGNGAFSNMVFQQENGGADPIRNQGAKWMMTNIAPVNAAFGRSFLPGGFLMIWGQVLSGQDTPLETTFNWVTANGGEGLTLLGVPTAPYIIMVTPNTGSLATGYSWSTDNYTTTEFDLKTVGFPVGRTFNYVIIGPKT